MMLILEVAIGVLLGGIALATIRYWLPVLRVVGWFLFVLGVWYVAKLNGAEKGFYVLLIGPVIIILLVWGLEDMLVRWRDGWPFRRSTTVLLVVLLAVVLALIGMWSAGWIVVG